MQFILNFVVISLAASICVKAETVPELVNVPPYVEYLSNIVLANVVLMEDVSVSNNHSAEFLKIYIAVIDLADQVDKQGENAYLSFYMETVKYAWRQVIDDPIAANKKLWDLVHHTNKELKKISAFVLFKQLTECTMLTSRECDLIIGSALNHDSDLKKRSYLLIAGGIHGKIFMEISNRFKDVSKVGDYDAEQFLVSSSDVMKPLVLAAYETVKVLKSLKL